MAALAPESNGKIASILLRLMVVFSRFGVLVPLAGRRTFRWTEARRGAAAWKCVTRFARNNTRRAWRGTITIVGRPCPELAASRRLRTAGVPPRPDRRNRRL